MNTSANFDRFITEYEKQLAVAIQKYPVEYGYPVTEVPTVVGKMKVAFIRKSYNKDGRAIKATCKALNIGYTYRDIDTFLGYNEI
jgi:hypothetical protein